MTARSPEIVALSRRICLAPDRIVKQCKQMVEIEEHVGANDRGLEHEPKVVYSTLCVVRYRCHLCFHLCYQRNSIAEHYQRVHNMELPEDGSVYRDADFHARRLEQAKPPLEKGRRERRKRKRPDNFEMSSRSESPALSPTTEIHVVPSTPSRPPWG